MGRIKRREKQRGRNEKGGSKMRDTEERVS